MSSKNVLKHMSYSASMVSFTITSVMFFTITSMMSFTITSVMSFINWFVVFIDRLMMTLVNWFVVTLFVMVGVLSPNNNRSLLLYYHLWSLLDISSLAISSLAISLSYHWLSLSVTQLTIIALSHVWIILALSLIESHVWIILCHYFFNIKIF